MEHVQGYKDTSDELFTFLQKTGFLEINENSFEKWLQSISYEDFRSYIFRINSIICDQPIYKKSNRFHTNILKVKDHPIYIPPIDNSKDILLKELFTSIKRIENKSDRAVLLYFSIIAIHPFNDGNGRTARCIYKILSSQDGKIDKEELALLINREHISHTNPDSRKTIEKELINPDLMFVYINEHIAQTWFTPQLFNVCKQFNFNPKITYGDFSEIVRNQLTEKDLETIINILNENSLSEKYPFSFGKIILLKTIEKKFSEKLNEPITPETISEIIKQLDFSDISEILKISKSIKITAIKDLFSVFTEPEKYTIHNELCMITIPIKNLFVISNDQKTTL